MKIPMTSAVFFAAFAACQALATELNIGFGNSIVPQPTVQVETMGPSRAKNGENLTFTFRTPITLTAIQLSGISRGFKGKVVVRNATLRTVAGDTSSAISLDGLWQYNKIKGSAEKYQDEKHQDLVMLGAGNSVALTALAHPAAQIVLNVEGFANADASLLVKISTKEDVQYQDYLVSRTSSTELLGGFIDESDYAGFTGVTVGALMANGHDPKEEDLNGQSYVCTAYSRSAANIVDYKSRRFYSENGILHSTSETNPPVLGDWMLLENGWASPFNWPNPCGDMVANIHLRMLPSGSTVSEVVIDRETFTNNCLSKDFSQPAIDNAIDTQMWASAIDASYLVISYEFCHKKN